MIIKLKGCLVPQCGGADHVWEFERFRLRELRQVQEMIGMEPGDFQDALNDGGLSVQAIDALLVLIMLMHKRDGVIVALDDIDADADAFEFLADPAPEPEEKPTGPPPTSHQPEAAPATSSTSGPEHAEASEPRSSITAPTFGGGTGSP